MRYSTLFLSIFLTILTAQFLKLRSTNKILSTALHISLSNVTPSNSSLQSGIMAAPFLASLAARRSLYHLSNKSTIPDKQIKAILVKTLETVPSAFNSQTTRMVLLVGEEHGRLWRLVGDSIKELGHANEGTEKKMKGFENAYGTVMFCEFGILRWRLRWKHIING